MKIIVIFSFLILLITAFTVSAGNVEVFSDGSMRVKQEPVFMVSKPDITVTQNALKHSQWRKAIKSPNKTIWIKETTTYDIKGFYLKKRVKKLGVLYDTRIKKVDLVRVESIGKPTFNLYFALIIVAIVFMIIVNGIAYGSGVRKDSNIFFIAVLFSIFPVAISIIAAITVIIDNTVIVLVCNILVGVLTIKIISGVTQDTEEL